MPEQFNPHNPIPGNPRAIQGEIERLRVLRDRAAAAVELLRGLLIESWSGRAAGRFTDFRAELARQWGIVRDDHDAAVGALSAYHVQLVNTRVLATDAVAEARVDGDWARAAERVAALRAALDDTGARAAQALREAARSLRGLSALLSPATPEVAPAAAAAPLPLPEPRPVAVPAPPRAPGEPPAPYAALLHQSPVGHYRQAASVNDELLDAVYFSSESLPAQPVRVPQGARLTR